MENEGMGTEMTDEQKTLVEIQAQIEALPPEIHAQVEQCASVLRSFITMYDIAGRFALALVGAEAAAEQDKEN